jgi:hypothetical protein
MHDVQTEHELQALQLVNVAAHREHEVFDEQYPALQVVQVVAVALGQDAQFVTRQAVLASASSWPKQMIISMI